MPRRKEGRLSVYWSKRENDIMFDWQSPARKGDAGTVQGKLCHREYNWSRLNAQEPVEWPSLIEELEARGYDITTLRVSIDKKPTPPDAPK